MFILDMNYIIMVMIPGLLLGMWAQARVRNAYARASKIRPASGLSGAEAAQIICREAGMTDVRIEPVQGFLSDHYDPRHKVLRLSPDVYNGRSLAALGIAAHEAGHAIQDAVGYAPLRLRGALVPMASIGSGLSYIVILAGFFMGLAQLVLAGVILFSGVVIFQLVNLPCEFNASSRAREILQTLNIVRGDEDREVKRVLGAAAMTYVAATITTVLTLLYYVMLFAGSRE
ncbi:zinc metallopeptidase [Planctomycetales bacterium ZRK34]|nr:zinc metallopeptidase [Planctomycetales bacterium ZRK34]